jgi:formate-dependent nitrite reductase membrane component NrfD
MAVDAVKCAKHGADLEAIKAASGSANMIFIIGLVLGIICCILAGVAQFRKMGLPMVIVAAILGLVGSIVAGVFFSKKGAIDECKELYEVA